jgi:hypothetical protein
MDGHPGLERSRDSEAQWLHWACAQQGLRSAPRVLEGWGAKRQTMPEGCGVNSSTGRAIPGNRRNSSLTSYFMATAITTQLGVAT